MRRVNTCGLEHNLSHTACTLGMSSSSPSAPSAATEMGGVVRPALAEYTSLSDALDLIVRRAARGGPRQHSAARACTAARVARPALQRADRAPLRRDGACARVPPRLRSPWLSAPCLQPPPAGQKRVKESWENIWYIGMFGTMGLASVLLYYKPDTRCVRSAPVIFGSDTSTALQHTLVGTGGSQVTHAGPRRPPRVHADPALIDHTGLSFVAIHVFQHPCAV
jgi:hypothetical protein